MGPLVEKVGEKILDERISLVDDPHYAGAILSCPFDDEGTPTRRTPLVEKGVFRHFLTDLNAASKIGVTPTGHGFRERILEKEKTYGASPNPDVSNLVLEPGDMTVPGMRGETGTAVEIHHITGILLGDMTNGDFSGNLELAFKVENVPEALSRLRAHGLRVLVEPSEIDTDGLHATIAFFEGPNGESIELIKDHADGPVDG